jgi:hypothetical protein
VGGGVAVLPDLLKNRGEMITKSLLDVPGHALGEKRVHRGLGQRPQPGSAASAWPRACAGLA